MKPSLQLRLGQQLTLTPQLRLAIRLLQLSSLELEQELSQALESNPLLEREDEANADEAFEAGSAEPVAQPAEASAEGDGPGEDFDEVPDFRWDDEPSGGSRGSDIDGEDREEGRAAPSSPRCSRNCRSRTSPTSSAPACRAASVGGSRSRARWRPTPA